MDTTGQKGCTKYPYYGRLYKSCANLVSGSVQNP